jgi:hypothetical protein
MITFDEELFDNVEINDDKLYGYLSIPKGLIKYSYHTGSSAICNPPVTDTDIDFIVYTENISNLDQCLGAMDVKASCSDGEEYELGMDFWCYRKNEVNLIVTSRLDFYHRFVSATKLAKRLNLLNKEDRIILFKYFLYGEL